MSELERLEREMWRAAACGDWTNASIFCKSLIAQATAEATERAAQVCEKLECNRSYWHGDGMSYGWVHGKDDCAAAIRRGGA